MGERARRYFSVWQAGTIGGLIGGFLAASFTAGSHRAIVLGAMIGGVLLMADEINRIERLRGRSQRSHGQGAPESGERE